MAREKGRPLAVSRGAFGKKMASSLFPKLEPPNMQHQSAENTNVLPRNITMAIEEIILGLTH